MQKGSRRDEFLNEMKRLGRIWQDMSEEQQAPYKQASKEEFQAQRSALAVHGVKMRGSHAVKASDGLRQETPPADAAGDHGYVGPYQLGPTSRLGGGSYGNVYRRQHPQSGCNVAVKVYRGLQAEDDCRYEVAQLQYLLKNIQSAKLVWFPVLVNSAVKGRPWPWMAAELCGPSLSNVLRNPERHGKPKTWSVASQLRSALDAMHGARVLHLDIKPGNVLWHPVTDLLKLCDFGMTESMTRLAKPAESPRFLQYTTAAYRPPELWPLPRKNDGNCGVSKKLLTPAVDVWGYGCLVYEVETGRPFMDKGQAGLRAWCQQWPELWRKASQGKLAQSGPACHACCATLLRAPDWAFFVLTSCAPDPQKRKWPAQPAALSPAIEAC